MPSLGGFVIRSKRLAKLRLAPRQAHAAVVSTMLTSDMSALLCADSLWPAIFLCVPSMTTGPLAKRMSRAAASLAGANPWCGAVNSPGSSSGLLYTYTNAALIRRPH